MVKTFDNINISSEEITAIKNQLDIISHMNFDTKNDDMINATLSMYHKWNGDKVNYNYPRLAERIIVGYILMIYSI